MIDLKKQFIDEKQAKRKGGLYHKPQVSLAYNSNRIEGNRLTEEQTRYIFETRTIGFREEETLPADDIIETSNHFVAFDFLLDSINEPLSNEIIKTFHRILKSGTADATKPWFNVGDWKKLANEVAGMETTLPQQVDLEMKKLNDWYNGLSAIDFENVVEYHYRAKILRLNICAQNLPTRFLQKSATQLSLLFPRRRK